MSIQKEQPLTAEQMADLVSQVKENIGELKRRFWPKQNANSGHTKTTRHLNPLTNKFVSTKSVYTPDAPGPGVLNKYSSILTPYTAQYAKIVGGNVILNSRGRGLNTRKAKSNKGLTSIRPISKQLADVLGIDKKDYVEFTINTEEGMVKQMLPAVRSSLITRFFSAYINANKAMGEEGEYYTTEKPMYKAANITKLARDIGEPGEKILELFTMFLPDYGFGDSMPDSVLFSIQREHMDKGWEKKINGDYDARKIEQYKSSHKSMCTAFSNGESMDMYALERKVEEHHGGEVYVNQKYIQSVLRHHSLRLPKDSVKGDTTRAEERDAEISKHLINFKINKEIWFQSMKAVENFDKQSNRIFEKKDAKRKDDAQKNAETFMDISLEHLEKAGVPVLPCE